MRLTFLGTGAADWNWRDHHEDPEYRRNSALLIDDCLLIDPGPDVPDALATFGKAPERIRYIINTHKHRDHFNEGTVAFLGGAELYPLAAGETKTIGTYTVTALAANHATCAEAVHFIISDGEKSIFYGLDGAWLLYDEYKAIKQHGVDIAVLDATIGEVPGDFRIFEHNDLNMVREMKATLEKYVGRFVISHMARTLHASHKQLSLSVGKDGIEAAFDGYETEV